MPISHSFLIPIGMVGDTIEVKAIIGIFLPLLAWKALAIGPVKEIGIDWNLYSPIEQEELAQFGATRRAHREEVFAQRAKISLIQGDLKRAAFYLNKFDTATGPKRAMFLKYSATLAFLQNNYRKVLEFTKGLEREIIVNDSFIDTLKLLSLLALGDREKLKSEILHFRSRYSQYSPSNLLWLDYFDKVIFGATQFYLQQTSNFLVKTADMEETRIWLKAGILLGLENETLAQIDSIPFGHFRSKRIRELVGLSYYRAKDYEKAKKFVADLSSSNASNILGNLELMQGKNELAYGHFLLALEKKSNSQAALERILPLAWKLQKWEKGRELLIRLADHGIDSRAKMTMDALFRYKNGDIGLAHNQLLVLKNKFKDRPPIATEQLLTITSLLNDDLETFRSVAPQACEKNDGISCWLYLQEKIWPKISSTIKREDKFVEDIDSAIESTLQGFSGSLDERVFINPKLIERLDDNEEL